MVAHIQANNISIAYTLDGPQGAPVIMFSTSLMCDHRMWDKQLSELVKEFRVLRYDTRGHGDSEGTAGAYSLDLLADDVASLLAALNIDGVHFVGLSLGGFIGQAMALRHPDTLNSLVLCDTACQMPPKSIWDDRIRIALSEGLEPFTDIMVERWFTEDFKASNPEEIKSVQSMIRKTSVDGLVGCCHAAKNMNFSHSLKDIKTSTLILVGEHDPGTPVSAAVVLRDGISGAELRIIENAAHLTNIEKPKQFNSCLKKFVDKI